MPAKNICVPIDDIFSKPDLSLTMVRWVAETEEIDEDGDIYTCEKEMFDVVGERNGLRAVEAAAQAIAEGNTFLPIRFWLICDDNNEHDDQAVGIHAIVGQYAYHVGFLPRGTARRYRKATDATNQEPWLQDGTPVEPRPWHGRNAEGFFDDELCESFCWCAKKKFWNSLPNRCEAAAAEFRTCRGRVPEPMD